MPLRPVGNSAACQPNRRSAVSGSSYFCVASSIISTTPSTLRSAGVSAPMSMPRRRASDERTCSASRFSPSISLRLDHVLGQGLQHGLAAKLKPKRLHPADQPALPVPDGRERFLKRLVIPGELRPVVQFMDVAGIISASPAEIMPVIRRKGKNIRRMYAEIRAVIRRKRKTRG